MILGIIGALAILATFVATLAVRCNCTVCKAERDSLD